jgi:hypothetical protein
MASPGFTSASKEAQAGYSLITDIAAGAKRDVHHSNVTASLAQGGKETGDKGTVTSLSESVHIFPATKTPATPGQVSWTELALSEAPVNEAPKCQIAYTRGLPNIVGSLLFASQSQHGNPKRR